MTSTRIRHRSIPSLFACVAVALLCGCSSSKPAAEKPADSVAHEPALLGEMKPVVSVKELMHNMIDPLSDNIFDAVSTIITKQGVKETTPKTDDDWDKVRTGAVTLAEGIYLLKVPRPFAPPGDLNNSTGPNAPELSPTQITEKVARDPVLWNAKIEALRNVALEVLEVVKKKDTDQLFSAAGDLDEACEGCHIEYWYPGEKALMARISKREAELARQKGAAIPGR